MLGMLWHAGMDYFSFFICHQWSDWPSSLEYNKVTFGGKTLSS